jgi:hypothetical protein
MLSALVLCVMAAQATSRSLPATERMDPSPTRVSAVLVALDARPYELTSAADGVWFDINGDGTPDHLAWTQADSDLAFLAMDRNGNGIIDDGTELLSSVTDPGSHNGFAALAALSKVKTGMLTADNGGAFFQKLLLWTDRNHDGVSQPDELEPFSKYFDAVGLGYGGLNRRDGNGNLYRFSGWVLAKGTKPLRDYLQSDYQAHQKTVYDVVLAVK